MRRLAILTALLLPIATLMVIGCTSPDSGESDSAVPGEHTDHDHSDMDKMKAELAKLSPEDAAAVEKQHVCPVTDEMLGSMGAPMEVDVDGTQVWICCAGCKDKLLESPDKYLAKLKD